MDSSPPTLRPQQPLSEILRVIAETDATCYPVVDANGRLLGVVSIEELRQSFGRADLGRLLIAYDLMQPVRQPLVEDMPLGEALGGMRQQNLESLPVVRSDGSDILAGMLERRKVERRLSREVIQKQQQADAEYGPMPT